MSSAFPVERLTYGSLQQGIQASPVPLGPSVRDTLSLQAILSSHQIESKLYERQALAEKVNNFEARLMAPHSELSVQTMKDPYIFDFIPFKEQMVERAIEEALVKDITKLLLELGTGFAFLGHQYQLNVGGDDFYIDLLFYNLNLRSYVVIELKTGEFKPEYAGQLNFYLSAVDGTLKRTEIIHQLDFCYVKVRITWLQNTH